MAQIHPTAIVAAGAELGEGVEIGPYSIVGENVKLGPRVRLQSHVVIEGWTEIGADCVIHPFANLGGPPQHLGYKGEATRVVVGERNTIRENATIHRGTPGSVGVTTFGSDGMMMAGSHVGHDCTVGDNVILAQSANLGGHNHIDDYVFIGGGASLHQNGRVGRYAFVAGMSAIHRDIIPFGSVYGNPAHIEGLNLIGMKRRGFSRQAINNVRAATKVLFAHDGTLQERVARMSSTFAGSPEVDEIIRFVRADDRRPLCLPEA